MPETKENTQEEKSATVGAATEGLENFEWDDGTSDFFGIENTAKEVDVVAEIKAETTETTEEVVEGAEVIEEENNEDFFGVKEGSETTPGSTTKETTEEAEEDYYRTLSSKMKEQGIFQNIEIPEEGEITEDKFIELQDLEVESRVDEAFEGFFSELDNDAAAFLKHKKEGGSTQSFFDTYSQSTGVPKGDLDDDSYQEKLARYYYTNVDKDEPEDIDDKIEWLKESGKLEKYAQKFDSKIKEDEESSKKRLAEQTKAANKAAEDGRIAFANSVQEALDNTDQVDNFTFTPKSKKSLFPFITKPTVKVGKNQYITGMQSKLRTALKTPDKMLILAQLLENDFDISGLIADGTTVNTKRLKNDIQRQKAGMKPSGSGKIGKKRSLADVDF